MIVVVNTSPLIALDRIGQLDILRQLFGRVVRPQSVVDELMAGRHLYGGSSLLFDAPWMETREDPGEVIFRRELGAGETAAIVLARKMNADLLLLDDLAARRVATELELRISGTLGVLFAASRRGYINDLEKTLSDLSSSGFRISDQMRKSILSAP